MELNIEQSRALKRQLISLVSNKGNTIVEDAHEYIESLEEELVTLSQPQGEPVAEVWQPMATAPKDGTMLRLLVIFSDNSTDDAERSATIGANNFQHDQIDEWKFAGWNWSHDCFTEGLGTPVGWTLFNAPPVLSQRSSAPPSREMILTIASKWSREESHLEFEVNDFVRCVEAILATQFPAQSVIEEDTEHPWRAVLAAGPGCPFPSKFCMCEECQTLT